MILHILSPLLDKFTLPFIKLMDDHRSQISGEHKYIFICRDNQVEGGKLGNNSTSFLNGDVEFFHPDQYINEIQLSMEASDKIIIHGLWRDKINDILVNNPMLLKKSFWFMYGGDYYNEGSYSEHHIQVIKNVAFLVTDIVEDFKMVQGVYGATGTHLRSLLYNSNVCSLHGLNKTNEKGFNILLGHSGISCNQHLKYLQLLSTLNQKVTVYCPLSYPSLNPYITEVINLGHKLFGDNFIPLTDFMSKYEYEKFLADNIDIAICASWRTHGIGTITKLLSSGSKVYISNAITSWKWFEDIGVELFSLDDLDKSIEINRLEMLDIMLAHKNQKVMLNYFSDDSLLKSLNCIYDTKI